MKKTPIKPRNGHTLAVLIAARISGCQNQKELSLDDQVDYGKEITADEYDGEATFHLICTKGKGEQLDRPELAEIETLLRSRKYDLFIVEDLGRLIRGGDAVRLLGIGVDHSTHTIVPNDGIDTRDETWEQDALKASADHVAHNVHTSKRIKQKSKNRFTKSGRATALPIHGYIVPPGAKTYDDWQRNESANPKIRDGAQILRETLNCSALADWFNEHGVPVGPYCRLKKWDGSMVRRFYANPILKGMPQRGKKHCVKHYGSGHRISVNNPEGPDFYNVPHLAHLEELEFDALNAALDEKNSGHGRPSVNGLDPLFRVPRKRTRFPGQHAFCWYCGRQYVWGANGITDNLMCNGPRQWHCWNSGLAHTKFLFRTGLRIGSRCSSRRGGVSSPGFSSCRDVV
jgi:site-specific DNA recombinase